MGWMLGGKCCNQGWSWNILKYGFDLYNRHFILIMRVVIGNALLTVLVWYFQDVHYGEHFSRDFVDSNEDPETAEGLMNVHNNEAGRRVNINRFSIHIYVTLINDTYCSVVYTLSDAARVQMSRHVRIVQCSSVLAQTTTIQTDWRCVDSSLWGCFACQVSPAKEKTREEIEAVTSRYETP
jgi:hypothetical protein